MMELSLQVMQALECPCCGQYWDGEKQKDTLHQMQLFGSKKHSVCIVCSQEVNRPYEASYLRKWNRRYKRLVKNKEDFSV